MAVYKRASLRRCLIEAPPAIIYVGHFAQGCGPTGSSSGPIPKSGQLRRSMQEPVPRPRFFYGWVIVAVLGVNSALAMAMGNVNFGLFLKPMEGELGITRAMFGWAQTARPRT